MPGINGGCSGSKGGKKNVTAIMILSVVFLFSGVPTLYAIKGIETATSEFAGLGAAAVPAIVIYAAFNTALLFGLLHGVMFFSLAGVAKTILIIVFTGAIAWFMGYVNEKNSNGSIIPSWIIHTVSNLFSGICAAFSII